MKRRAIPSFLSYHYYTSAPLSRLCISLFCTTPNILLSFPFFHISYCTVSSKGSITMSFSSNEFDDENEAYKPRHGNISQRFGPITTWIFVWNLWACRHPSIGHRAGQNIGFYQNVQEYGHFYSTEYIQYTSCKETLKVRARELQLWTWDGGRFHSKQFTFCSIFVTQNFEKGSG